MSPNSQVVPAPASGDAGQAKPPPATTGARVCKVPRESLDGTLGTCTRAAPRYWLRHNTFRTNAQIDALECRPPGID